MESQSVGTTTVEPALLPAVQGPTYARPVVAATQSLPAPPESLKLPAATQSLPASPHHPTPPSTPVKVARLAAMLAAHPDPSLVSYVVNGMQFGFDIGFTSSISSPSPAMISSSNHPSALANASFIADYLLSKCSCGETAGPFSAPPFPMMHISGLGVIPKHNGKLRLIHDLSSPAGVSVNDGISREEFSPSYASIDMAVASIMRSGKGAYLTKVDIRNAFRLCPVRPADWAHLGIEWQGKFYYDRVLPFGLRSAPFIFNAFADAVCWVLADVGKLNDLMHYLDDYLNITCPDLALATGQRSVILDLLAYLNIPVADEKVEGPTTKLVFLGLELDTVALTMRVPDDKVQDIVHILTDIVSRGSVRRRDLVSAVGKLSFAARAITAGRTFLRRLYDLMRATQDTPSLVLRLPAAVLEDLTWWLEALTAWNGKSFLLFNEWTPAPDFELQTDASGSWGYGAYFQGRWLNGSWPEELQLLSIEFKELYAIVTACHTWGHEWTRRRIRFHCDNAAVVACIKSGTSRSEPIMKLIRSLYHVSVKHSFLVSAVHIPGVANTIADSLSRNQLQSFRRLAPTAAAYADKAVPPDHI